MDSGLNWMPTLHINKANPSSRNWQVTNFQSSVSVTWERPLPKPKWTHNTEKQMAYQSTKTASIPRIIWLRQQVNANRQRHIYIYYITLHYITLHYIILYYIILYYILYIIYYILLYYIILYYIILYYIILYYILLYYIILYYIILYYTILYYIILYYIILYYMLLYYIILYCIILYICIVQKWITKCPDRKSDPSDELFGLDIKQPEQIEHCSALIGTWIIISLSQMKGPTPFILQLELIYIHITHLRWLILQ